MVSCQGPVWIVEIFKWLEDNLITQEMVDMAMNWMYEKGIIICNEITI